MTGFSTTAWIAKKHKDNQHQVLRFNSRIVFNALLFIITAVSIVLAINTQLEVRNA